MEGDTSIFTIIDYSLVSNNTVVGTLILLFTAETCKAEPSLELLFPRVWRCPQLYITIELNASWVITHDSVTKRFGERGCSDSCINKRNLKQSKKCTLYVNDVYILFCFKFVIFASFISACYPYETVISSPDVRWCFHLAHSYSLWDTLKHYFNKP